MLFIFFIIYAYLSANILSNYNVHRSFSIHILFSLYLIPFEAMSMNILFSIYF